MFENKMVYTNGHRCDAMHKKLITAFVALIMLSAVPLAVSADETEDIPTNAAATGVHDSLVAALSQANLVDTLSGPGPFTVFAPTDQAFADAGIDLSTFNDNESNATLVDILTYHVYSGSVESSEVTDGLTVEMLNGDNATFTVDNGSVMIEGANVTAADVVASNGIIHVIDKVLMPPVEIDEPEDIPTIAQGTGIHSSLVAALSQADLVATLQSDGPFTVFAPTDQAFSDAGIDLADFESDEGIATLQDILLYHVYSGSVQSSAVTDGMTVTMVNGDDATFSVTNGSVMINDATVTTADVIASNGVIHIIDKVLLPPGDDITDIAQSSGVHNSLVAALVQAELVATLQGDGPFTVFAPTDAAFEAAGINLADYDNEEGKATLTDILTYHVYAGEYYAANITDGASITMLNGDDATFTIMDGNVMIAGAPVTGTDVIATNGIVHVIDAVLIPPTDGPACDRVIGITPDGYGFNPVSVTIDVGQTVCWQWSDEGMAHNVKEVDGLASTTYVAGGITSGAPNTNVDFRYTFTEDTIFYYACEPHINSNMFGKVTVGDGGVQPTYSDDTDEKSDDAPGFMGVTMIVAFLGAVMFASRKNNTQ